MRQFKINDPASNRYPYPQTVDRAQPGRPPAVDLQPYEYNPRIRPQLIRPQSSPYAMNFDEWTAAIVDKGGDAGDFTHDRFISESKGDTASARVLENESRVRMQRGIKEIMKDSMNEHLDVPQKIRPPTSHVLTSPSVTWGVSDQYVILDSSVRATESDPASGLYVFKFMTQGTTGANIIGISDTMNSIQEIQFYQFYGPTPAPYNYIFNDPPLIPTLPRLIAGVPPAGVGNPVSATMGQMPMANRISIFIKEISRQSYSDTDNVRHHVEFDVTVAPTGDRALYTPVRNLEKFIFTEPITAIESMSLQFLNPVRPLVYLSESPPVLIRVVVNGPNIVFQFETPAATGLVTDDRIFVSNFNSGNALIDIWVNRSEGLNVTVLSPTVFQPNPNVDVTSLGILPGNIMPSSVTSPVLVNIAKLRMRIPIRARRILPKSTQHLVPV